MGVLVHRLCKTSAYSGVCTNSQQQSTTTAKFIICVDQLQDLQSQGRLGPALFQQATHSLEVLKASIETQLSSVLPGISAPAVDLSQFTTTLTNFQHQRELCLS